MRSGYALSLLFWLAPGVALACPCGVSAGPAVALTTATNTWAASASLSVLREVGSFDANSRFWPTPSGVRADHVLVDVAAAVRPWPRVELGLQVGAGLSLVDQPGVSLRSRVLGDTTARMRWDARTASDAGALPAFALSAGVRAPTGDASASGAAVVAPGLGLGAWEFALGGALQGALSERWQAGVIVEGAWRMPDQGATNGRQLGPRLTVTGVLGLRLRADLALAASLTGWWEGSVQVGGQPMADSSQRRVTASLGVVFGASTGVRWTATASIDPPLDALGVNSVAMMRASLGAVWAR